MIHAASNRTRPGIGQRALYALLGIALSTLLLAASADATGTDTALTSSACGLSTARHEQPGKLTACTVVQDEGHISITLADGRQFNFTPRGDAPGDFHDAQGNPVYRQKSHGLDGQMFRIGQRFLFVLSQPPAMSTPPGVAVRQIAYRPGIDGIRWEAEAERIYHY